VNFLAVSADYIIDLYDRYLRDPKSVDESWKPYFDELWGGSATIGGRSDSALDVGVARLLDAFRQRGHLAAKLDPLGLWQPPQPPELDPAYHGIGAELLDREITMPVAFSATPSTPRALLKQLQDVYCGNIGFDCAHVDDSAARSWLYAAAEDGVGGPDPQARRNAAEHIIHAHEFEKFLNRRFLGKKRFGADGAEAVVPWFEALLARCAEHGVRDVVIGGTARGRLNVMANVIRKPLAAVFHEFKGRRPFPDDVKASGDVPYHLGYESERRIGDTNVKIVYCHNPSHLEAINGVTIGRVRVRQDTFRSRDEGVRQVLGLLVHTDAAFAGQGVVGEVLQLSQVPDYETGGTIHIVINNQVGFTTDPQNGRSSIYCTDIARTVGAPVLHVNADDVDAVVRVARIAADYRARFRSDIIVDLVCYRRFGHNELDEPTFTQPLMYRKIAGHPPVRDLYIARIVADGLMSQDQAEAIGRRYFDDLDKAYATLDDYRPNRIETLDRLVWQRPTIDKIAAEDDDSTGLPLERLQAIGQSLSTPPAGVSVNEKIVKQLGERGDAVRSGVGITWAFGEALALASLACDGFNVRFSGQDTPRGAFSQRHFLLIDQSTGATVEPFNLIQEPQGRCRIIGSPLSEYSVLGFEYGYSMDAADVLVMWEAQFGDFANVAQVIFDQFIASGEDKWLDRSGLAVMLPHGLEGQGPDHSSGRIERFLQMCAGDNMKVVNCTTPANLFHVLRRQARAKSRKPLLIFTPKSLLRHRAAVSTLAEFRPGTRFRPVIGAAVKHSEHIRRVILCSGKIYYDLEARLAATDKKDVAVVRLEELFPFPERELQDELRRFPGASVVWCQEEPENMGAWSYVDRKIEAVLQKVGNACEWPICISRPPNASTAIGTNDEHIADQAKLTARAVLAELRNDVAAAVGH
jgi:2-oxoglutarate dehydrogenase E1 component